MGAGGSERGLTSIGRTGVMIARLATFPGALAVGEELDDGEEVADVPRQRLMMAGRSRDTWNAV